MRNIKLTIAFDGTAFSGWQRQKNVPTIQQEIEDRLRILCNHAVALHGAGRTDAGVHARGMVANFHTPSTIATIALIKGMNSLLPSAIRILDASEESHEFHARFSAKAKTYSYTLFSGPIQSPLQRLYVLHLPHFPQPERIPPCLTHITGTHDFASFEASGSRDPHLPNSRGSIRTLYEANFTHLAPDSYQFQFSGDGFLRHMVRNLVGTMIEVGQLRCSSDEFARILKTKNRSAAGMTAPAHGLVLEKITY
jgi:tRNA pseudouridine38-40 synthase